MKQLEVSCLAALAAALAVAACGSNGSDDHPAPAASGGKVGTGGTTAKGGAGTGGSVTATPFAFPQNKKPKNCTITTVANASGAVQSAYDKWKSSFVTSGSPGLRVQRPSNGNDTVSEGIAYGMLAALYMNDRTTFDGLWTYAKAHFDATGLMNWRITAAGSTASDGAGSATDADEDMAWALLGAAKQWGSASYYADGKAVVDAMFTSEIAPDGMLKPGDGWGGTTTTYPDYFSPAYYRLFATVTNNKNWSGLVIDRNYAILKAVSGTHGLVPDKTTGSYEITTNYSYDACRTPWRIAMDYCFNGEPRALEYLTAIGSFFNGVGATNIVDGYKPDGSTSSGAKNMAFIGPAGVAGMAGYPKLLDDAFSYGVSGGGSDQTYYTQSLKLLTMLMMSGNFIDFTSL